MPGATRGVWRAHFYDHPKLSAKDPIAFIGSGTSAKAKVYCIQCFNAHVAALQLKDKEDVEKGLRASVRSEIDIEAYCKFFSVILLAIN